MQLRNYQEDCLSAIADAGDGRWLCQLATGLGKTVIFANIPLEGRELILSHRQELVCQPLKYYDCPVSVEMGDERASDTPVVSASVQTLTRRLGKFPRDHFDTIIVDECHHAASESYRRILDYFQARRVIGFTATPNRADGRGLDDVFDDIIFQRDLRWGIVNGWLSPIDCRRVHVGFDLRGVATRLGDFSQDELARAVNVDKVNKAVAEAVKKMGVPPVLIFAVDVAHAHSLAEEIGPEAVAIDGATPRDERADVLARFGRGEIKVLVNCALFTEGTDVPGVQTVIIARPTRSIGLYTQMVGRGTRLAQGKDKLRLIDCVGVSRLPLCTAPSLIGLDDDQVAARHQLEVEGDLLADIPNKIAAFSDVPESWIRNVELVDLWAAEAGYDLHEVNYTKSPDGSMTLDLKGSRVMLSAPDLRGQVRCVWAGHCMYGKAQTVYDNVLATLKKDYSDQRQLWDTRVVKRWGTLAATPKQVAWIQKLARRRKVDVSGVMNKLTKMQAGFMITRLTS